MTKRTFVFCVLFLLVLPLVVSAGIPEDLAAKKPLNTIYQNALLAGLTWDRAVCDVIKGGVDPVEAIFAALRMGADPQGVIKGARCAGGSDKQIRDGFAKAQEGSDVAYGGGGAGATPLAPITPSYSGGGGGGGAGVASPWR